jgi:seryl-tRNA(Sec) selenium transferase
MTATSLEAHIRRQPVPVIARIDNDQIVLDLRTVEPDDDALVVAAFD